MLVNTVETIGPPYTWYMDITSDSLFHPRQTFSLFLHCSVEALAHLKITWYRTGLTLQPIQQIAVQQERACHLLANLRCPDRGSRLCHAIAREDLQSKLLRSRLSELTQPFCLSDDSSSPLAYHAYYFFH